MNQQQTKVYNYIATSIRKNGYAMPNVKIAEKMGLSRQRIDYIVNLLCAEGRLVKLKPGLIILPKPVDK